MVDTKYLISPIICIFDRFEEKKPSWKRPYKKKDSRN